MCFKTTTNKHLKNYQQTGAEFRNIGPQNGCSLEDGLIPFVCDPVVILIVPLLLLCPKRTYPQLSSTLAHVFISLVPFSQILSTVSFSG